MKKRYPFMQQLRHVEDNGSPFRIFKLFHYPGNVSVSVQASGFHASTPRAELAPTDHTHFEVAIFKQDELVEISEVLVRRKVVEAVTPYFNPRVLAYYQLPAKRVHEILHSLTLQAKNAT